MKKIGLMQGRLTAPKGRKEIQFMPTNDEITKEFLSAKVLNLDYIEWIIPNSVENPMLKGFQDLECLKHWIKVSNVKIDKICLDFLIDLDFNECEYLTSITDKINWLANTAFNINCNTLIIPIHEKNRNNFNNVTNLIRRVIEDYYINVFFEFLDSNSFSGVNFLNDVVMGFKEPFLSIGKLGCCFDIGNNYERDIIEEMKIYSKYGLLKHIHIKEKNKKGISVPLGEGVIGKSGWKNIFKFLKGINYKGDFTLQVARGKDGGEIETIKKQIDFVNRLL